MTIFLASSGGYRALVRADKPEKARWIAAKLEADRMDDVPDDFVASWQVAELAGAVTHISSEGQATVVETWWFYPERDTLNEEEDMTAKPKGLHPPEVPEGLRAIYEHRRCVAIPHLAVYPDPLPMSVIRERELLLSPRGGDTVCHLLDVEGHEVAFGVARCRKDSFRHRGVVPGDQFSYRKGRVIALGRALKRLAYD